MSTLSAIRDPEQIHNDFLSHTHLSENLGRPSSPDRRDEQACAIRKKEQAARKNDGYEAQGAREIEGLSGTGRERASREARSNFVRPYSALQEAVRRVT